MKIGYARVSTVGQDYGTNGKNLKNTAAKRYLSRKPQERA